VCEFGVVLLWAAVQTERDCASVREAVVMALSGATVLLTAFTDPSSSVEGPDWLANYGRRLSLWSVGPVCSSGPEQIGQLSVSSVPVQIREEASDSGAESVPLGSAEE
jgi:hypothetical protein